MVGCGVQRPSKWFVSFLKQPFFWLCFIDTYIPYFSQIYLQYLKKEASFLFQMASLNVSLTKKRRVSCRGQLWSAQFVYCVGEKSALLYCQDMLRYMKTESKSTIEIQCENPHISTSIIFLMTKDSCQIPGAFITFCLPLQIFVPNPSHLPFSRCSIFQGFFSISSPRPPF